jgi:hypothetical protein
VLVHRAVVVVAVAVAVTVAMAVTEAMAVAVTVTVVVAVAVTVVVAVAVVTKAVIVFTVAAMGVDLMRVAVAVAAVRVALFGNLLDDSLGGTTVGNSSAGCAVADATEATDRTVLETVLTIFIAVGNFAFRERTSGAVNQATPVASKNGGRKTSSGSFEHLFRNLFRLY